MQTKKEISRLHQRLNTSFIDVTHDQVEAMTMGTCIAVNNFGELQQIDTPQTLYDKPANQFVAGFIGSPAMNLFQIKIVKSDGRLIVDTSIKEKEINLLSTHLKGLADTFYKNICVEGDIDKEEALFDALARYLC